MSTKKRGRPPSKITRKQYIQDILREEYYGFEESYIYNYLSKVFDKYQHCGIKYLDDKDLLIPTNQVMFKNMLKGYFYSGIQEGLNIAREKIFEKIVQDIQRLTNASGLIDEEIEMDKKLRSQGYALPMKLPSDLKRKIKKPEYTQKEIAHFTRTIKEYDGIPFVNKIAKIMKVSVEEIYSLKNETKRHGKVIEIIKNKEGKEYFYIE